MPTSMKRPSRVKTVSIFEKNQWKKVPANSREFPLFRVVVMTPDRAREILETRNTTNRRRKHRLIAKITSAIKKRQWHLIHQGIAFFENGSLADGQNRLQAIVNAGRPVPILVAFGIQKKAMVAIDGGVKRSPSDIATILGYDVFPNMIPIRNFILERSGSKNTISVSDEIKFGEKHRDAIKFAAQHLKRKFVSKAPVQAVVARAWYKRSCRKRLAEFCSVLNSGSYNEKTDMAAIRLRDWLENHGNNSGPARVRQYKKTEYALDHFLRGENFIRLFDARDELFPLPEERKTKKKK